MCYDSSFKNVSPRHGDTDLGLGWVGLGWVGFHNFLPIIKNVVKQNQETWFIVKEYFTEVSPSTKFNTVLDFGSQFCVWCFENDLVMFTQLSVKNLNVIHRYDDDHV